MTLKGRFNYLGVQFQPELALVQRLILRLPDFTIDGVPVSLPDITFERVRVWGVALNC